MGTTVLSEAFIRRMGTEFREQLPGMSPSQVCEGINALAKKVLGGTDSKCCECSVLLAWLLREGKGLDACVRVCEYCTCPDDEECICAREPHFYVSCMGQILDPTRDQFDDGPLSCSAESAHARNYVPCPDGEMGEPPVRPTRKSAIRALKHPCTSSPPREIDVICRVVGLKSQAHQGSVCTTTSAM